MYEALPLAMENMFENPIKIPSDGAIEQEWHTKIGKAVKVEFKVNPDGTPNQNGSKTITRTIIPKVGFLARSLADSARAPSSI